tara:strand:- start:65 stop:445 length:381 start_codon:yes stop_codon:yes gene_type:complete
MAQDNVGSTERIDAITLATADVKKSVDFYEALGFTISYGDASSSFVTLESGSCFVNLWEVKPDEVPSAWWGRVIFHVDDVDAVYRLAVEAKLSPRDEPVDAPWGERFFAISDPSGHDLSFAKRLNT